MESVDLTYAVSEWLQGIETAKLRRHAKLPLRPQLFENLKTRVDMVALARTGLLIQIRTTSLTQPSAFLPAQGLHGKGHNDLISHQRIQINSAPIMAINIEIVRDDALILIA
jgi:hypothetical protein